MKMRTFARSFLIESALVVLRIRRHGVSRYVAIEP
jgi:hypothetical protein